MSGSKRFSQKAPAPLPTTRRRSRRPRLKVKGRAKPKSPLPLWLGLTAITLLSASAGAFLAVTLSSTPLLQRQLSAAEAAIFRSTPAISSGSNLKLPQLTQPVNILVLGAKVLTSDLAEPPATDKGYHALVNSLEGLTDTMLLLRFDPTNRQMVVLSIPRDTRAWIEGHGLRKINEANAFGGPALAAQAVSELLDGVAIDRYVRINVQGVEKLLDALGGVNVYVPKAIKYQDDSQRLYINLKPGLQHLNGNQALQFMRFRYDELGDIGRIQRQQSFLRALAEQTLTPATVQRSPQILSIIKSHIDTNLSIEELLALGGFAAKHRQGNVKMLMVPGQFSRPEEFDTSYWLPSTTRIQEMASQYFGMTEAALASLPLDPASLNLAIQDSTGQPQATTSLVERLNQVGYHNVYPEVPWSEPLQVTRIVAQQGDSRSAKELQRKLGFGEVRIDSTGVLRSDITIQIGQDWLQKTSLPTPPTSATPTSEQLL